MTDLDVMQHTLRALDPSAHYDTTCQRCGRKVSVFGRWTPEQLLNAVCFACCEADRPASDDYPDTGF